MKPCLLWVWMLLPICSFSQIIKKTLEKTNVFPSMQVEQHFDRNGELTKYVKLYHGLRKDSTEFSYTRDASGNILSKKTFSNGDWIQYESFEYTQDLLAKKVEYSVISPLLRLSEPLDSLHSVHFAWTAYTYDEQDSLIREAEFWETPEKPSQETLYTYQGDSIRQVIRDHHHTKFSLNAKNEQSQYMEQIEIVTFSGDTSRHRIVQIELDGNGQPQTEKNWSQGSHHTAPNTPTIKKGRKGYQAIIKHEATVDEAGNLIMLKSMLGEKEQVYEREIEYYD